MAVDELPVVAKRKRNERGRDIVYLPTRQHHTGKAVFIGVLCRALLAAMLVAGLCLFLADALELVPEKAETAPIFYAAVFFALSIALVCRGGKMSPVGIVVLIGGVFARIAAFSVDIVGLVSAGVASLHNAVVDRFVYAGLTAVYVFKVETQGAYSEADAFAVGLLLLVLLLSVIFVPAIVRRCRVLYLTFALLVFTPPVITYNIMRTNWGFAVLVSAVTGVIVLRMHDRGYTFPSKKKRLVADEEVIPMFDALPRKSHTVKKRQKRERGKAKVDDSVYKLEKSSDRRRRIREEKRAARAKKREEMLEAKKQRREIMRSERLDRKTVNESAALGGAAGLITALLAMLIIALPARFVEESDPGIPYIKEIMEDARFYVTAFISSDEIDLNHISSSGLVSQNSDSGPRTTEAVYPEYQDIVLATVEVPYNAPVYLRSWIGTTYEDDHWYSATLSEASKYKTRFGEGFSPEMITENYHTAMNPNYARYFLSSGYGNKTNIGFIIERVNVTRTAGTSSLLYLPSFVRPSVGVLSYNSSSKAVLPYSVYFDGIWTSKFFTRGTRYSTESLVPVMKNPELGSVFANGISEYKATIELLSSGEPYKMIGGDEELIKRYIETYEDRFRNEYGIEIGDSSLLYRFFFEMTDEERDLLIENAALEEKYRQYVFGTYLQTDADDDLQIRNIAQQMLRAKGLSGVSHTFTTDDYHEVVMALVDYLSEHYTYSIERPEAEETEDITAAETDGSDGSEAGETEEPDKSAVVKFLTETYTGYCVQFASSLTLMLRTLGIPARYCEGFIASDYETDFFSQREASRRYKADVLDSDAHAWVEVYYDGLGWVQYEATPPYHDAMYGGDEEGDVPPPSIPPVSNNDPIVPPSVIEPVEPEDPVDETDDGAIRAIIYASLAVFSILVISIIIYAIIMKHRSDKAQRKREALIKTCCDTETILSDEELRLSAHEIDLGIFDVYTALGLPPDTGELMADYAKRLREALGGASDKAVSRVLELISREEFGHSLPRDGVAELAEYYGDLTRNVYAGLSPINKFVMRYIKRVM